MKLKVRVCLLAFASLFSVTLSAQDVPKFDLSLRPIEVDDLLSRFKESGSGAQNQNNLRVPTGGVFRF